MPRVTFVIQRYLPAKLTGSETVIARYAEALAKQPGFSVNVITADTEMVRGIYDPRIKVLPAKSSINGVTVNRLKVNWLIGSTLYLVGRFWPWLAKQLGPRFTFLSFGPHFMGLEKAILTTKPDFIHTGPMPLAHVLHTVEIASRHSMKTIISPMMHFEIESFANPLIIQVLNQAIQVACFTDYEKQQLIEAGVEPSKLSTVPATYLTATELKRADSRRFRSSHPELAEDPFILFLGTKAYDKGALTLLRALPLIREQVPNCQLVTAGLSTLGWQQQRLPEYVLDLEYLIGKEKLEAIAGAKIMAVPSRTESFGIVSLEAMAQGVPVIVGDTGASQELVEVQATTTASQTNGATWQIGHAGVSVEFDNTEALAEACIALLTDQKLAAKLQTAGLTKAQSYQEADFGKQLVELYS